MAITQKIKLLTTRKKWKTSGIVEMRQARHIIIRSVTGTAQDKKNYSNNAVSQRLYSDRTLNCTSSSQRHTQMATLQNPSRQLRKLGCYSQWSSRRRTAKEQRLFQQANLPLWVADLFDKCVGFRTQLAFAENKKDNKSIASDRQDRKRPAKNPKPGIHFKLVRRYEFYEWELHQHKVNLLCQRLTIFCVQSSKIYFTIYLIIIFCIHIHIQIPYSSGNHNYSTILISWFMNF